MRCGCGLFSLIGLIPVLLLAGVLLVAGSSAQALPDSLASIGATLERGAATLVLGGDADKAGLRIRAVETKERADGTLRLIIRAELLDPKAEPATAAATIAPVLAAHTDGPLSLARNVGELVIAIEDADKIGLATYRASGSKLANLRKTNLTNPTDLLRLLDLLPSFAP
jgi:hypothetical protein